MGSSAKVRRVLVLGASRGIGLEVVKRALEAGYAVRAFSRSAETIGLSHDRLEACAGDAREAEDVKAALVGVDVVVQALGVAPSLRRTMKPVTLFSQATNVLLPAMAEAGVKRLVAITGFGAGDSAQAIGPLQRVPFRLALGRAYDDKSRQERLIRDSDLDWTIVRPVILTDGPRTGRYRVLTEPEEWRGGFISRADVADFVVRALDDEALIGQTPVILQAPLPF